MATDIVASVKYSLMLSTAPALFMLAGSLAVMACQPHAKLVSSMQHLGAGFVTSAVAVELIPELLNAPNDAVTLASIIIGFSLGVALMLLVKKFCDTEGDDHDHDAEGDEEHGEGEGEGVELTAGGSSGAGAAYSQVGGGGGGGGGKALKGRVAGAAIKAFPLALCIAINVDAFVDGLLVGVSSVESSSAGVIMAVALTIEMTFLGVTYSLAVRDQPMGRRVFALVLAPAVLIVGGLGGAVMASSLSEYPFLKTGLLAFGVAALLYLVTEDLLLEAHEAELGDHVWCVSGWVGGSV